MLSCYIMDNPEQKRREAGAGTGQGTYKTPGPRRHSFFIHSPTKDDLGYFQVLAVMTNTALNMHVWVHCSLEPFFS